MASNPPGGNVASLDRLKAHTSPMTQDLLHPHLATTPSLRRLLPPDRVVRLVIGLLALGGAASAFLLLAGASPGAVLVPLSVATLVALVLLPFPAADFCLAFALIATLPVLPPLGLPNLPLAAVVVVVAVARLMLEQRSVPPARVILLLALPWAVLAAGLAMSHWPPLGVWLRPAAILGFGALTSYLGLLVWRDRARRWRWLTGIAVGLIVVSLSAFGVFVLQYILPIDQIVDAVIGMQGYLRGEAAAAKFEARNNWVISGTIDTLRAVSPLFPAPNNVGGYIGIAGPLSAALWVAGPSSRERRIGGVAVAVAVATLFVTHSRSSWAAAFLAGVFIVAAVLVVRRRLRRDPSWPGFKSLMRHAAVIGLAVAIGVFGVVTTANEQVGIRITDPGDDVSVTERIDGDLEAADQIVSNPFRGSGLGNWTGLPAAGATAPDPYRFMYIHNVYLQYGVAAGLLGAIWVVLTVGYLIVGGVAGAAAKRGRGVALLGIALAATGIFAATQFFFDDNLLNPQYAWLLFWAFGGAVGLASAGRSEFNARIRPGEPGV
jgi:hypothetical protein